MICSHFLRSQAKLVLVVPSMAARARSLSMTMAQQGELLQPFCGAEISTSTPVARMSTHIAAQEAKAADGLVLLAYPLHPAGQPDKLRDAHLRRIAIPMLFVSGTRDSLAQWELMEPLVTSLGENATLHALEGRDHSMTRRGAKAAEDEAAIAGVVSAWLGARRL